MRFDVVALGELLIDKETVTREDYTGPRFQYIGEL